MKKLLLISFLIGIHLPLKAQQNPQYSQWMWNPLSYNPAISGIKPYSELKGLSRLQWAGFKGAPQSNCITYTSQLPTKRTEYFTPRHGIGVKFENDYIGPLTTMQLGFSYAFHFNFTENKRLSLGMGLGLRQFSFDNTTLLTLIPDPATQKGATVYSPNANIGVWWNGENHYASMCIDQLTNSIWKNVGIESRFRTNITLTGGIKWLIPNNISIIPNVMIKKTLNSPMSIDLNTYVDFSNKFKIGIGLRNNESFVAMFQVKIKEQFAIGYSADIITNKLNTNYLFTHEIGLQYITFKNKDVSKLSCPLF